MFDFFKSRKRRIAERLSKEVQESLLKIVNGLNMQIDALMFFERKSKAGILKDPYTIRYIFGIFDAVTMNWGLQIRNSLGEGILMMGFTGYVKSEFSLEEETVACMLDNIVSELKIEPSIRAVIDGGVDGIITLKGGAPGRLLEHFECLTADVIEISPAQLAELQAFRQRKDRSKEPFAGSI